MIDSKKNGSGARGSFGAGYVSVIMIFVVIVLTVLAALSYSAVGMSGGLNRRAHENMQAYYTADAAANRKLMQLDEAAFRAYKGGDFSKFRTEAESVEGVTLGESEDGYTVSWSEKINDRVRLDCKATVFGNVMEHGGMRYEVTKWETVTDDAV